MWVQRDAGAALHAEVGADLDAAYSRPFSAQTGSALPYPYVSEFTLYGLTQEARPQVSPPTLGLYEFPSFELQAPVVPETAPIVRETPVPRAVAPLPRRLVAVGPRIHFQSPMLEPFAHTRFCLQYKDDCRVNTTAFRGSAMTLDAERWAELNEVNARVNRTIAYEGNSGGLDAERWLISPAAGDCNDYAVTKRHELIARGWPARALLLAEVVVASGEHHLVLVIHSKQGDYIADNLVGHIRAWSLAPYSWVRIQSPTNPHFWSTVARGPVVARAGERNRKS